MDLEERLRAVEARIAAACVRSGRKREDVRVIAVTKYVGVEETRKILESGVRDIGENRWQDAKPKWEALSPQGTWHFIGHLQTNKVKDVVGKFSYIHSLDRLPLAREIDRRASALGIMVACFIQVNVSGEATKHGLPPSELHDFVGQVRDLPHIRIAGLMTMAPHVPDPGEARPVFRELRRLRDELNEKRSLAYEIPHLSMGMSNDFEVAVEEGATWLRLGSVIVGA